MPGEPSATPAECTARPRHFVRKPWESPLAWLPLSKRYTANGRLGDPKAPSMRILPALALLACGAGFPLVAADKDMPMEHMSMVNSSCPMCGNAVGETPSKVKITVGEGAEAKTYFIACDNKTCADAMMKDPEPTLKKHFGKDAPGAKTQYK